MHRTVHYKTFKEKYIVQYGVKTLLQFLSINLTLLAVKTLHTKNFIKAVNIVMGLAFS